MRRIREFITFCTGLLLCMACATDYQEDKKLQMAIQSVDNNPQEALQLLEGIPYPEQLDPDSYMRYVVTLTQASYMNHQDITDNTLILEAQRYFSGKQEPEMTTRASFYAAIFYQKKQRDDQALEYYLLANYYAQRAKNNLFQAKSAHWIGSTYYNKDLLDSARIYYQQAEELYTKETNAELHLMDIKYMLGRTYHELQQSDLALNYFNDGLKTAQKLNNQLYESRFAHYKGVVFREKKDYSQAKEFFDLALSKKPEAEDSLRIYLSYARLYKATGQSDSTKYYLDRVNGRVEELTYPYNRVIAYRELAHYYEKEGNIQEMKHYLKSVSNEERKIKEIQDETKIQEANQRFEQYKQKAEQKYCHVWIFGAPIVFILIAMLAVYIPSRRKLKTKYNKLRQQQLSQKTNLQYFLVDGLRNVTKNMIELRRQDLINAGSSTWKQLLELRNNFNMQIADLVKTMFEKSPQKARALAKLDTEDLCIIHLSRMKYPDDSIRRILGYENNSQYYIALRKLQIHDALTCAGLKKQEINSMFSQ